MDAVTSALSDLVGADNFRFLWSAAALALCALVFTIALLWLLRSIVEGVARLIETVARVPEALGTLVRQTRETALTLAVAAAAALVFAWVFSNYASGGGVTTAIREADVTEWAMLQWSAARAFIRSYVVAQ